MILDSSPAYGAISYREEQRKELTRKAQEREMEAFMSADEAAFSAIEKEQASAPLKGARGFLYMD